MITTSLLLYSPADRVRVTYLLVPVVEVPVGLLTGDVVGEDDSRGALVEGLHDGSA